MTIDITPEKLIKDIQAEFNHVFPFLKIEFFRKGSGFKRFIQRRAIMPNQISMGTATSSLKGGKLQITSSMTGKELEKKIDDEFGIGVQLYRKSGNLWLEITITDNWTMKQQNDHGCEISSIN